MRACTTSTIVDRHNDAFEQTLELHERRLGLLFGTHCFQPKPVWVPATSMRLNLADHWVYASTGMIIVIREIIRDPGKTDLYMYMARQDWMLDYIPQNNLINGMLPDSSKKFYGNILITTAISRDDIPKSQMKEIEYRVVLDMILTAPCKQCSARISMGSGGWLTHIRDDLKYARDWRVSEGGLHQLPAPLEILSEEIPGLLITVQIHDGERGKFWMIKEDISESDVYRNLPYARDLPSLPLSEAYARDSLSLPLSEFLYKVWQNNGLPPLSDAKHWLETVHWLMLMERHSIPTASRQLDGVFYCGVDVSSWALYPEPMPNPCHYCTGGRCRECVLEQRSCSNNLVAQPTGQAAHLTGRTAHSIFDRLKDDES
ncbi:hypothetical protein ARMSODRAFT_983452 [Armillaria solidipes]|uniref:Uncharacterized protein n=1 Tax=Armillaria solidipes TaxID=1076256 RepID=A0A2H3AML0_9AGAR|nr:hypothetical protein ARMSODRAFT_983452 [Armillaria solidipes]